MISLTWWEVDLVKTGIYTYTRCELTGIYMNGKWQYNLSIGVFRSFNIDNNFNMCIVLGFSFLVGLRLYCHEVDSLVLLVCRSVNFTTNPYLLFWGHTGEVFDIRVLSLFLPTWVSMWNPVATGSDVLPTSYTSGTLLVSILLELGFVPTSADWTGVHSCSLHWHSFCH